MCGIIGIIGVDNVVHELYNGLIALQHRGQDAGGIVTFDSKFHMKKGHGLVREVFKENHFKRLSGTAGIAHVRYATVGSGENEDIQPSFLDGSFFISMAHNGNLTNFSELKKEYNTVRSGCDLEAILKVFYNEFPDNVNIASEDSLDAIFYTIKQVMLKCKGSYSVITHIPGLGMMGFKDPYGIKPLMIGKKKTPSGNAYAFASEDVAFQSPLDFDFVKDVDPGSVFLVTESGEIYEKTLINSKKMSPCIFEWIYFAKGCSSILGVSVSEFRYKLGRELANEWAKQNMPNNKTVICSEIPSASERGAVGFSDGTGIKYRKVFDRNNYVGRGFIQPTKKAREENAKLKLPIDYSVLRGVESLILVDDSIVRGDTSKQTIKELRTQTKKRGLELKNIYFLSLAPQNKHPCVYGIDMSVDKELIAAQKDLSGIKKYIGMDELIYQKKKMLGTVLRNLSGIQNITYCDACFSGNYPTGITQEDIEIIKKERIADKGCEY
ncbi:amidophosphoribosyltransferase [Candidatus Woesearchaeota archaeon]|jgi:amidophosphoribosyltransferase|nr:amidophosphoribosyltransferase [Candidatus Woesearchaeota archaeon]MBT6520288.1 amidophosphoribosyltransferase [Candidatus Woesearchaeota archaeon]MBT7367308.1 amidophosphoribosyltransferase [Candidatus Woesearchaeota archaeon]